MGRGRLALGLSPKVSSGLGLEDGFVPTDIAGCVFWIDADQESYNDNDAVPTMHDWVGGHDLAEATNRPTFKTGIMNGHSVVRFDGNNDQLCTASEDIFGGFHNQTWFVVYVLRGAFVQDSPIFSTFYSVQWDDINADAIRFSVAAVEPNIIANRYISKGDEFLAFVLGPSADEKALAITDIDSGTGNLWVNGVNDNDAYVDQTDLDPTYAGAGRRSAIFGNYDLAEVIVYNVSLSSGDRALVEDYLKTKYGISY